MSDASANPDPGTERDRVLVVGATGTVGTPLVTRLRERDVHVTVATRRPERARTAFGEGPTYVDFDLDRPETWARTLADVDRLFLLYPPGRDRSRIEEFASAADGVGVDRVVFLSILGAEALPILPHRRIEKRLRRSGMAVTILRASWFMQNLSDVHRRDIVERDQIVVPAGEGRVSAVDARDVGAVAATVLTESGHANRAYDLTGPAALDFEEVATAFSRVLDRSIAYADPSRPRFGWHMYRRGFSPGFVAFMVLEYSVVRLGAADRTTDAVERLLGRPPRTIETFVADHADDFRPARTTESRSEGGP